MKPLCFNQSDQPLHNNDNKYSMRNNHQSSYVIIFAWMYLFYRSMFGHELFFKNKSRGGGGNIDGYILSISICLLNFNL